MRLTSHVHPRFEAIHTQSLRTSEVLRREESRVIECHWTLAEWRNSHTVRRAWNRLEPRLTGYNAVGPTVAIVTYKFRMRSSRRSDELISRGFDFETKVTCENSALTSTRAQLLV